MNTNIAHQLADYFTPNMVNWKAQTVSKDKKQALAVAYIDARAVQERLDAVLGLGNWSTSYRTLNAGEVVEVECTITATLPDGRTAAWTDAGEGDSFKSAYSDGLKRAAVRAGIGRYLYDLPLQWVPYDDSHKRLATVPLLPSWALPKVATAAPAPAPVVATPVPAPVAPVVAAPVVVAPEPEPADELDKLFAGVSAGGQALSAATLKRLNTVGSKLYGKGWDGKRPELVGAVSRGRTTSSRALTEKEAGNLIEGMSTRLAEVTR